MSSAFVKEPEGGEAFEDLPDRPISTEPNFVTPEGLAQIEAELARLHEEHAAAEGGTRPLDRRPGGAGQGRGVERVLRPGTGVLDEQPATGDGSRAEHRFAALAEGVGSACRLRAHAFDATGPGSALG